uniref:Uncharacterized protein n=1 Tax=uncultured marine group II/III euryarchaeote KM3_169_C11 TaxID=1457922 RepID=A0A075GI92_9EURY|nr:hypothetical protein [uncultured marine group II/III euryarchaeote KM3_169_C11]
MRTDDLEQASIRRDEAAAATELGYVFTFLLGLLFLSMFSVWTWDLESSRQKSWTAEAMDQNLDAVAAAVERADSASHLGDDVTYAEPVPLLLSQATRLELRMLLDDEGLLLQDGSREYTSRRPISAGAATNHTGEVSLNGIDTVWVVLHDGEVRLQVSQPGI